MYQGEAGQKAYMEQHQANCLGQVGVLSGISGISGPLGGYTASTYQLVDPSSVTVEKCENGFLVRIGYQKYIAVTATDVAELVAQKLQGGK